MDNEQEISDLREQMGELSARSMVLSASQMLKELEKNLDFEIDLRSFIAGLIAQGMSDTPVPVEYAVREGMEHILPHIARLELERATDDGDPFADLPVYDPGNGS